MHVCGYLITPALFVRWIKWLFSLFIKDRHSFDSPNSSSFISAHCCELVLDKNSLTAVLLPGGCLTQRKDWMFFISYVHVHPARPVQVWYLEGLPVTWHFITCDKYPVWGHSYRCILRSYLNVKTRLWLWVEETKCFREILQAEVSQGSRR